MADLRIVDAPLIPKVDITGSEKIPTGGSGNYSISLDGVAEYTQESLDLADKTDVLNSENGVKALLKQHTDNLSNPHVVTKDQVGLGNVDNTADADKPMSNLTQSVITTLDQKKADKTSVYLKTETYNKNDVDSALANKPNSNTVYTKTETNNLLNGKVSSVNGKNGTAITLTRSDLGISSDEVMQQWLKEARFVIDESGLTQQQVNNGLNSIAEMLAIQNPKNGNSQFVKSLDGGHFTYQSSKAGINNGVTIYNGWTRITFETVYRSEWVGVTGIEGDDCVPKLKKLFEYVTSLGGGTALVQDGTHSLDTVYVDNTDGYTEHYAFGMYNNVTIEGTSRDKTIFKLKDNLTAEAPQRWGLFVDNHRNDIVNFTAKNFKVDFNGYNNLCTATLQPVYVVGLVWNAYTAKNITFDNIWCDKNASWNTFFFGTKCVDATVQNCLFTEHSDAIPNNLIKDHSTIYINGQNARVINNVFLIPDDVTSYITTGIEAHGVNTLVQGNLLRGYGAPFLAASTESDRQDVVTFVSNIAKRAQLGIAYNSMFGTLKVSFIGNTVDLRKARASDSDGGIRYAHGAIESGGAINGIADPRNSWTEIYVLANTFEQEEPDDWNDTDKYINTCHSIKEAKLLVSKGNTFRNFKGGALDIAYHRNFLGAVHELSGNTYIGCGSSTAQNAYQAAYRLEGLQFLTEGGIDYGLLDKITISNDTFINCAYGAVLGKQNDLTASQIDITGIKFIGNFVPPAVLLKPIDIIAGHTINIEYSTNGFVASGQTLTDYQGLSGSISLKHWSPTSVDDFLLQNISYVKAPYFGWSMRALSSNIPSNSVQFGAFPNKDGDRIESVSSAPSGYSSYVRSNSIWYGIGKLDFPI